MRIAICSMKQSVEYIQTILLCIYIYIYSSLRIIAIRLISPLRYLQLVQGNRYFYDMYYIKLRLTPSTGLGLDLTFIFTATFGSHRTKQHSGYPAWVKVEKNQKPARIEPKNKKPARQKRWKKKEKKRKEVVVVEV